MTESPSQNLPFTHHTSFSPAADFDAFLKQTPAKWVVYLLSDETDQPIQLLCVKNLRYSLKRRLGGEETIGPTRRVNYRDLVRHIHYRRVDSAFEADWLYYEAARALFPQTYHGMVGFRPAWFVHVNAGAPFPRYTKTIDLSDKPGQYIGPIEDKHAAAKLIQIAEDAFDLCRYYNILLESPNGQACAYKEMGKCPAPCDGSISMPQYQRMIDWSAEVLVEPQDYIREQTRRMQQAAAELRFETAAKIKSYIDQLSQLAKGPFRHTARLKDFQFLSLQHGPRPQTAKLFLITPGQIEELLCLTTEHFIPSEILRLALTTAATRTAQPSKESAERIGITAHHLFTSKATHGVFLPLSTLEEKFLPKAWQTLQKQTPPQDLEEEGVVKELQAL